MLATTRIKVAALVLSAAGFVGITSHEAFRSLAYNDGVGISTIGFGTTTNVKPGDRITVEQALVRALGDAQVTGEKIKKCITVPLSQNEFDAYVSLAYNIGPTAFCNSTLAKKLNAGDYAGACSQISRWTKAGGRELRGLVKRRAIERTLCES